MSDNNTYKKYSREFKLEAVKMVLEQGLKVRQAALNLGIAPSTMGQWVKQFSKQGSESFPGSGKLLPTDERVRTLERDLKRVTQERDILKKAIAYFAEVPK
jgi:transposase